ncbi:CBS domain-containing protein, partial [Vibrio parahaemolyticus]
MVHIKDVFAILATGAEHPASIAALIREPLYVPMSRGALDLLADMRQKRVHLAIVLDEYFGTEGLVTIEDLIEEIVGDIEDEHD